MNQVVQQKLSFKEKIGYALGDTATNIAWRSLTTFLLVFYTDAYGLPAAAAGVLLLITRLSDGVTDIIMGMIADRTNTRFGKFRPWILWTTIPFGLLMALTFTTPPFGMTGKLVYAYVTYIALTLAYTANNVPYSALMGVMTADHTERTSLSSFRFTGAYLGGILTQGFLLYLVAFLGQGDKAQGYRYAMYVMAALLIGFLFITFSSTKERIKAPKAQKTTIGGDLSDLVTNVPWLILLIVGFLFVTFNSIKQGVTVYYFQRYIGHDTMASTYMVTILVCSIFGALITTPLVRIVGKKQLYIIVMAFAGITTGGLYFAQPGNLVYIYTLGSLSEFAAGAMPVLFFAMLGDAADFSEHKNQRRATGLIFSAGTFAMKFGGGVAGAIIGFILGHYGYNGMDENSIPNALPGIRLLMSIIPALFSFAAIAFLAFYPLTKERMNQIEIDLQKQRENTDE